MSREAINRITDSYEEIMESISDCESGIVDLMARRDNLVTLQKDIFHELKEVMEGT